MLFNLASNFSLISVSPNWSAIIALIANGCTFLPSQYASDTGAVFTLDATTWFK